jgi:PAS domain S-box-containing protein/putative nucleotidyltransferase with HDIG domain
MKLNEDSSNSKIDICDTIPFLKEVEQLTEKITPNYDYSSLQDLKIQKELENNNDKVPGVLGKEIKGDFFDPDGNFTRLLLESAAHPIIITNADSSIRYVNPALENLTGFTHQELVGRKFPYPWWPVEKIDEYKETTPKINEIDPIRFERCYLKKSGEQFWVNTTIKTITGKEDRLIIWEDISKRMQADKARIVSDERYRQIFESVTSCIAIYEAVDNGSDFIVKEFNFAAEKATGMERAKVINRRVTEVFPNIKRFGLLEVCQRVYETGIPAFKPASLYSDGRLTLWAENYVFMLATGELVAVFDDVTQRKKTESEKMQVEADLKASLDRTNKALYGYIDATAKMVEMRDPYTAGHQQKVAKLSAAIAVEMGLSHQQVECIWLAARVHDIGKIYVPAEILARTGILTDLEFSMIKTHVQRGYDILKTIDFPWPIANIVWQHHERSDGSGYPNSLKGEDILLEARIIAVSDTVEAMTSHRPYRAALGINEALKEITQSSGKLFDHNVVNACLRRFSEKNFTFSD